MLEDFLITSDGPKRSEIKQPCCRVGDRTQVFATGSCSQLNLLPVYECWIYGLCSPFGPVKDSKIVQACVTCEDFRDGPRQCDIPQSPSVS